MADAATLRRVVELVITRLLAGGETALAEELVHPDFVKNEADPERRHGPSGAAATSEWLRSCFGGLRLRHPPGLRRRRHGRRVRDHARDHAGVVADRLGRGQLATAA